MQTYCHRRVKSSVHRCCFLFGPLSLFTVVDRQPFDDLIYWRSFIVAQRCSIGRGKYDKVMLRCQEVESQEAVLGVIRSYAGDCEMTLVEDFLFVKLHQLYQSPLAQSPSAVSCTPLVIKHPYRLFVPNCQHLAIKHRPTAIILPLLHSEVNYRRSWSKICHRALNMLPHYLANLNVQVYNCSVILARIIDTSNDNFVLE